MLLKGFFRTQSSNPDWPTEEWTLIDQVTTPGSYSKTLGFGKYKIELSGGGGSGGAAAGADRDSSDNYGRNGSAGKLFISIIEVSVGTTRTISGIVASGGGAARARGGEDEPADFTAGSAGTGATNGTKGTGEKHTGGGIGVTNAAVGGSGGGSTSAVGIGTAAGGAGGNAHAEGNHSSNGHGGAGASGTNQGDGASGGVGRFVRNGQATSGAGSNGWVKIYRSTTYPEPI